MRSDSGRKKKSMVLILTGIEEMSPSRVMERIGEVKYKAIRSRDSRPMFVELVAGHEGVSTGRLYSGAGGNRPAKKRWSRRMIEELAQKLGSGVPVYTSHRSEGKQRVPAGEIVSAFERWIRGVLGASGIAYISDPEARKKIKAGELDTCSIEAEVECHRDAGSRDDHWIVDAVRKVSGVALGNSRLHSPGFPGAALVAAVEEFENEPAPEPEGMDQPDRDKDLSRQSPSEVFSREKLLDDPVVAEMIRECRERDAERIKELDARIQAKEQKVREVSRELSSHKRQEERRNRAIAAEREAERLLDQKNLSDKERELILEEVASNPPDHLGPDGQESREEMQEAIKQKIERELTKIDRLREAWAKDAIATPPEKETFGEHPNNNPLIPGQKG